MSLAGRCDNQFLRSNNITRGVSSLNSPCQFVLFYRVPNNSHVGAMHPRILCTFTCVIFPTPIPIFGVIVEVGTLFKKQHILQILIW